jgi:CBS domain-containing protein
MTDKILKAGDIMTKDVITVRPDTSVEELGRLFIEKDISGAPVVDDEGNLIGIVTENDLIKKERPFHIPTIIRIFDAIIPIESDSRVEEEIKKMAATTVGDICTKEVITVDVETPLPEIADIMTDRGVHLLPVMDGKRLVGIIGKKDIIRAIAG